MCQQIGKRKATATHKNKKGASPPLPDNEEKRPKEKKRLETECRWENPHWTLGRGAISIEAKVKEIPPHTPQKGKNSPSPPRYAKWDQTLFSGLNT